MAVKTGYSGITIRDLTDDQLRQWFWFNSQPIDTYILTTDTTVVQGKTYYSLVDNEFEEVIPEVGDNPAQNRWYEFRENAIPAGAYVLSQPVESFKKTPSEIANLYMQSGAVKLQNGLISYATLNTSGLFLEKGGITAGTPREDGFIYLSTENYPDSYSINGSIGIDDWKQIIGTNFGVRSDGTLYASEVNVAGAITAGEGSNVGSWVINDVSIHSDGKDEWDTNVDGIYIGQYEDPELERPIYTISGGKTNYSLTGDNSVTPHKKYYVYAYIKTTDTERDGSKIYYAIEITEDTTVDNNKTYYNRTGAGTKANPFVCIAITPNPLEPQNPHDLGWYEIVEKTQDETFSQNWCESVYHRVFNVAYTLSQDTTVDSSKTYYEYNSTTETYEEVTPQTGDNPSEQGWYEHSPYLQGLYESSGPTWYINSDGSANFGSLTVNQNGILDVPAASISGTLTAGQIEVSDLAAITANIGSTINSELTSNTLEINATNNYEPTNDTRIHPDKFYYKVGTVYIDVENPSGSPKDNGYYESGEVYEEVTPETGDNPYEEGWYEVVYNTIVNPSIEDSPYEEGWYETSYEQVEDPTGNPNEQGWYEYDATNQSYELTQDTAVDAEKTYYVFAGYVLSADIIVNEGKTYYELEYVETTDTQVVSDKTYYVETIGYVKSSDDEVNPIKTYKYVDEDYRIELISGNINPKEEGYFERVIESYIRLNTERSIYNLTDDTEVTDLTKEYYYYLENYFDTKDVIPDPDKIYYKVQINGNEIDYIPIPDYNIHSGDNPSENGWYEREAKYDLVKNLTDYFLSEDTEVVIGKTYYEKTIIDEEETYVVVVPVGSENPSEEEWYEKTNPFANYYYELNKTYTAEINLQKGDIVFESNDKPVFSINSEEEDDINVTDVEILEKIKFGNLELVPYQNGLVIQVGGGQN